MSPSISVPRWLRTNRNLALFSALLLSIVMLPTFEDTAAGEVLLAATSLVIIIVALAANGRSRALFWLTLALSVPAVAMRAAAFLYGNSGVLVWFWAFTAAVLLVSMIRLLEDVFGPTPVNRDKLFACATVYLLIGLLWCFLFAILEEASPGSFSGLGSSRTVRVADLTYFSFNLVTNVALTNAMPVTRTAQMLVLLQEFASVLYMAFVISRLVGMYTPTTPTPRPPSTPG